MGPMIRPHPNRRAAALLVFGSLFAAASSAQGLVLPGAGRAPDTAPAQLPVPDPATLKPGWWEYLAPEKPDPGARVAALLARATSSSATLSGADAASAANALERLRISLDALPAMLAATPASPAPLPPPAAHYTTLALLGMDRDLRALQDDLDARHSAIAVARRAVRDGQRQADSDFAAYLARTTADNARIVAGLQVMASRAEIAVTEAEIRLRQAEIDLLVPRIADLRLLRDAGSMRVVADTGRPPARLRALIAQDRARLETQRGAILRTRARRGELMLAADSGRATTYLADINILAAMIEEGITATRIALYETELDWVAVGADGHELATGAGLESQIAERHQLLTQLDADSVEWRSEIERLLTSSLRDAVEVPAGTSGPTAQQFTETGRRTLLRLVQLRSLRDDLRFALDATADLLAASSGWRGWWRTRLLQPALVAAERADELLGTSLFRISDAPVTVYGLLRVALFMIAAVVLSRLGRRLLARFGSRQPGRASAGLYTVGRLLQYVLITAGLVVGLASIGLDFSQLALVAGALSIGIGFGLQSMVNNFVSGLMILFEQSLKIGDVVELDSGVRGAVREIRVRSTLITTSDGIDIIVPNAEFVAGKVTNFTLNEPYHRIHVPFGVAYSADKEQVRTIVTEAARGVPFTHITPGREPDVWLVRFGDNSLDFELVVWINPAAVTRPGAISATYLWEIESALRRHGIEIPFPQRDVHLRLSPGELATLTDSIRKPA